MLEVKVKGLVLDSQTNMPIVILEEMNGKRALPIWIGENEANAIAMEMQQVRTPRPLTHDLIKNILQGTKAKVNRVIVSDLKDNTYYATISLSLNNDEVVIDSRPSDAIAVALKLNAPIFVAKKVMEMAATVEMKTKEEDSDKWIDEMLDSIKRARPEEGHSD
ncbi:MAG: bifunctional nuclease family protein [Deltaproteobacteria bacterium]|nr:bifunctional nuclease family protein [Deltaproteobacteria bacterium]MBI3076357.1 bifunctional nuclease family protein [Deltaproteobacteria bacterium]